MFIKEVPFRGNGKSAHFYDDHIEFNGVSLCYDDIAVLATNGSSTIHTYVGIPVGRSFNGGAYFKMNNGKTHKIIMNAMTIFGIPILLRSPRKSEKLYPALYEALDTIIAKYMAQKLIDKIKNGETVEFAGLSVNNYQAKKAKAKENVDINRQNYGGSRVSNGSIVTVFDKNGKDLWQSSVWNDKNILLVPYVLDAIFGE